MADKQLINELRLCSKFIWAINLHLDSIVLYINCKSLLTAKDNLFCFIGVTELAKKIFKHTLLVDYELMLLNLRESKNKFLEKINEIKKGSLDGTGAADIVNKATDEINELIKIIDPLKTK